MNDPDYEWLIKNIPLNNSLPIRQDLAARTSSLIKNHAQNGNLPFTLGVFGGWGSGKTTFLAMLARELDANSDLKVLYFNAWKYAGFMELVPALVYKILKFGARESNDKVEKAIVEAVLSLGRKYGDSFGRWVEDRMGVNLVQLYQDAIEVIEDVASKQARTPTAVLSSYYTQVDKAQDLLLDILGTSDIAGEQGSIVVLVDELDRCDPDEAFTAIKQLRVLFAMRSIPVAFVVCANPDPIGQAIKHRYGLKSETGDYEARRILEKFVDSYEDFTEPAALGSIVESFWAGSRQKLPWIVTADNLVEGAEYTRNTISNTRVYNIFSTQNPLFSNIRVLKKNTRLCHSVHNLEPAFDVDCVASRDCRADSA